MSLIKSKINCDKKVCPKNCAFVHFSILRFLKKTFFGVLETVLHQKPIKWCLTLNVWLGKLYGFRRIFESTILYVERSYLKISSSTLRFSHTVIKNTKMTAHLYIDGCLKTLHNKVKLKAINIWLLCSDKKVQAVAFKLGERTLWRFHSSFTKRSLFIFKIFACIYRDLLVY